MRTTEGLCNVDKCRSFKDLCITTFTEACTTLGYVTKTNVGSDICSPGTPDYFYKEKMCCDT